MKKALRDILLIVTLFVAILLAPLVIDALSGPETSETQKAESSQDAHLTRREKDRQMQFERESQQKRDGQQSDMPPQPQPVISGDENAITNKLAEMEEIIAREAIKEDAVDAPAMPADCPDIRLEGGQAAAQMDGGKGRDMLKTGGGDIALDGAHFSGMEVIDVRNGEANKLSILSSGLVTLHGHHAYVIGDRDIDTVYLDPCLRWNDPISISDDGPEPLLRYDAYDRHGNVSYLSVTEGVKVKRAAGKSAP